MVARAAEVAKLVSAAFRASQLKEMAMKQAIAIIGAVHRAKNCHNDVECVSGRCIAWGSNHHEYRSEQG